MIWAKWEIHHSPHCFSYFETFVVLSISFCNACQSHYGWIWLCYAMSSVTRQNFELTGYISSETCSLDQGLANIFYKGPDSKYFRLCRPHMLFYNYSTFMVWHKSSQRWYDNIDDVNKTARLCSSRTLFMVTETIILMCHNYYSSFDFFLKLFKNVKTILRSWATWKLATG